MDFGSKPASSGAKPPMKRQIKVDEDEGSPLQNGVNLPPTLPSPKGRGCKARKKKSNDQRKPSGYAIPVISFPPRITLPITPASNRASKRLGVAKIKKVIGKK
jgi:hypothetical protein